MDINHLRGSADLWDKIMIIAIIVTVVAVTATGASAWLSIKFNRDVRVQETAAFDRYRLEAADHVGTLEMEAALAKERTAELERTIVKTNERAALARQRAVELERMVADASARADEARQALERSNAPPPSLVRQNPQEAASVPKYVGGAAIYIVDDAPDATEAGSSINAILTEAGWATSIWTWKGVSGILGVVVLTKEGDDPATDRAASGIVDAFRSAGFNVAKANWPADWRRYQGTLFGPQTPEPTEAPIRIVIGMKCRQVR